MPNYKRIFQLDSTSAAMPDHLLALDSPDWTETLKISKEDFLADCLQAPQGEHKYPLMGWVRRNGEWYPLEIDKLVKDIEDDASNDVFYVRKKGHWVAIQNLKGDMITAVYDEFYEATDIFNHISLQTPSTNYIPRNLLGEGSNLIGNFLNTNLIYQEATEYLSYTESPREIKKISKVEIFQSKNDIFQNRSFTNKTYSRNGAYSEDFLHSLFTVAVRKGDKLKLQNLSDKEILLRFVSVDQNNHYLGEYKIFSGILTNEVYFRNEATVEFPTTGLIGIEYQESGEDFKEDYYSAFSRYRIPVIGSLSDHSPTILSTEYPIKAIANSDYPLFGQLYDKENHSYWMKDSLSDCKIEAYSTDGNYCWQESPIKQNKDYKLLVANLPKETDSKTDHIYAENYIFKNDLEIEDLDKNKIGFIVIDGQKKLGIITPVLSFMPNIPQDQRQKLTITFNREIKTTVVKPIPVQDGNFCLVGKTTYEDRSYDFGTLVFSQDSIFDYYLRKSGGTVSGHLTVEGPTRLEGELWVDHIHSLDDVKPVTIDPIVDTNRIQSKNHRNSVDITNDFEVTASDKIYVESPKIEISKNNEILINNNNLTLNNTKTTENTVNKTVNATGSIIDNSPSITLTNNKYVSDANQGTVSINPQGRVDIVGKTSLYVESPNATFVGKDISASGENLTSAIKNIHQAGDTIQVDNAGTINVDSGSDIVVNSDSFINRTAPHFKDSTPNMTYEVLNERVDLTINKEGKSNSLFMDPSNTNLNSSNIKILNQNFNLTTSENGQIQIKNLTYKGTQVSSTVDTSHIASKTTTFAGDNFTGTIKENSNFSTKNFTIAVGETTHLDTRDLQIATTETNTLSAINTNLTNSNKFQATSNYLNLTGSNFVDVRGQNILLANKEGAIPERSYFKIDSQDNVKTSGLNISTMAPYKIAAGEGHINSQADIISSTSKQSLVTVDEKFGVKSLKDISFNAENNLLAEIKKSFIVNSNIASIVAKNSDLYLSEENSQLSFRGRSESGKIITSQVAKLSLNKDSTALTREDDKVTTLENKNTSTEKSSNTIRQEENKLSLISNYSKEVTDSSSGQQVVVSNEKYNNSIIFDKKEIITETPTVKIISDQGIENFKNSFSVTSPVATINFTKTTFPKYGADSVLTLGTNKELISTRITNAELDTLHGIKTNLTIQRQLDTIPKLRYLQGTSDSYTKEDLKPYLDGKIYDTATSIERDAALAKLGVARLTANKYPEAKNPNQWDAISIRFELEELELKKDLMFFYQNDPGTPGDPEAKPPQPPQPAVKGWFFLYFLSTAIERANGENAGIVESNSLILFSNGEGNLRLAGGKIDALSDDSSGVVVNNELIKFTEGKSSIRLAGAENKIPQTQINGSGIVLNSDHITYKEGKGTVRRANGDLDGLVIKSDDITFSNGRGTVLQANKVKNSLTIHRYNHSYVFDGSGNITIPDWDTLDGGSY